MGQQFVTIELPEDILERDDYIEVLTVRFSEALTDLAHQVEDIRRKPKTVLHLV